MTAPEPSAAPQPGRDGEVCATPDCGHRAARHLSTGRRYCYAEHWPGKRCLCRGFRPAAPSEPPAYITSPALLRDPLLRLPSEPPVPGAVRCWDDEPGRDCGGRHPEPAVGLPPVGLRPRWLVNEQRAAEVVAAIGRYEAAGISVPDEWRQELAALASRPSADTKTLRRVRELADEWWREGSAPQHVIALRAALDGGR